MLQLAGFGLVGRTSLRASSKNPQAEACATFLRYFSAALFPAAISLCRAICVQVRRRAGESPTTPRLASPSSEIGGNPAVPSSEFTSARFSTRSRAASSSSSNTYRERKMPRQPR